MFSPTQLRGPDGRWISTGARKISRAERKKKNKKKHAKKRAKILNPVTINKAASRQQRGVGLTGLKDNLTPYARVNKKSVTLGANTGTFIPGTNKRVVVGTYVKIESVSKSGTVDKIGQAAVNKLAPDGSARALVGKRVGKNALKAAKSKRVSVPGVAEARLGTSRKAGTTLIVRRGKHSTSVATSVAGVAKYETRMKSIQGRKVPRTRVARRKQSRKKKN